MKLMRKYLIINPNSNKLYNLFSHRYIHKFPFDLEKNKDITKITTEMLKVHEIGVFTGWIVIFPCQFPQSLSLIVKSL